MSGFRVDIPEHAEPWVTWAWIRNGELLAVDCANCGSTPAFYAAGLRSDPGWLVRTVEKHNSCPVRDLDPWTPTTPQGEEGG